MRLLVLVCPLTQYGGAIFLGKENGRTLGAYKIANATQLNPSAPPDPINRVCSISGRKISRNCFTYHSVQIFMYCAIDAQRSDPPHKIMQYWFNHSTFRARRCGAISRSYFHNSGVSNRPIFEALQNLS